MADVCVMGLGYIGLPTAATIASRGIDVLGVDVNQRVVDTINDGEIHIVEPELDIIVRSSVQGRRLRAATEPEPSDIFLIAVPTPFDADKRPDLRYVEQAGRSVAKALEPGNLVILESTCPVGATEIMTDAMRNERPDLRFADGSRGAVLVAHCPERVLPGKVLRELVENDRVIGGLDNPSTEAACRFYKNFVEGECIPTDARTAELAKLTENAFRDVNIAFANELSMVCDDLSVDVWELIALANRHPRVNILKPGPGVGGHCIAVDPWFIISASPARSLLMRRAREVNDGKPAFVISRIRHEISERQSSRVAIIGLSFKPDVDDLRESPSARVAEELCMQCPGVDFAIVEPFIDELPPNLRGLENASLTRLDEALAHSDLVVGLVPHSMLRPKLNAFRQQHPERMLEFSDFGVE